MAKRRRSAGAPRPTDALPSATAATPATKDKSQPGAWSLAQKWMNRALRLSEVQRLLVASQPKSVALDHRWVDVIKKNKFLPPMIVPAPVEWGVSEVSPTVIRIRRPSGATSHQGSSPIEKEPAESPAIDEPVEKEEDPSKSDEPESINWPYRRLVGIRVTKGIVEIGIEWADVKGARLPESQRVTYEVLKNAPDGKNLIQLIRSEYLRSPRMFNKSVIRQFMERDYDVAKIVSLSKRRSTIRSSIKKTS